MEEDEEGRYTRCVAIGRSRGVSNGCARPRTSPCRAFVALAVRDAHIGHCPRGRVHLTSRVWLCPFSAGTRLIADTRRRPSGRPGSHCATIHGTPCAYGLQQTATSPHITRTACMPVPSPYIANYTICSRMHSRPRQLRLDLVAMRTELPPRLSLNGIGFLDHSVALRLGLIRQ